MERQTEFTLHAWCRMFGYGGLIVGLLVLLYQGLMFMRLGTWDSVGLADAIHAIGWDEVYWLPSAEHWPTLNKLLSMFLQIPVWMLGIALWLVVRLSIGSPKKDETL